MMMMMVMMMIMMVMISGGVAGAKKGTLTFMVGAAGDQFTALEVCMFDVGHSSF